MRIAGLHADQSLDHVLADGQRLLQVQAATLLARLPLEHADEPAGQQLLHEAAGLGAEAAEVQAGQVRVPGPGRGGQAGGAGVKPGQAGGAWGQAGTGCEPRVGEV